MRRNVNKEVSETSNQFTICYVTYVHGARGIIYPISCCPMKPISRPTDTVLMYTPLALAATTAVTSRLVTRTQDVIVDYVRAAVIHATV